MSCQGTHDRLRNERSAEMMASGVAERGAVPQTVVNLPESMNRTA